ncbi:MAG TPA: hypothetical protein VGM02_03630 [Acidobacteriaceae bacterium]
MSAAGAASTFDSAELFAVATHPSGAYRPGRIVNEYSAFLPGEQAALADPPKVSTMDGKGAMASHDDEQRQVLHGQNIADWVLLTTAEINGVMTAVFEKHATHRGAIAYVTVRGGTIALIPKQVGHLSKVRPRPTDTPHGVKLERPLRMSPGPDVAGEYILKSIDDPCYENVAALGAEYIGWSLVANEEAGALRSIYLEADGTSRQPKKNSQVEWAPDLEGPLFDPSRYFPFAAPERYAYRHGYSKRTLLGGYLPVADTAVWNAEYGCGYELMMLLPPGMDAQPIARMRMTIPAEDVANYDGPGTLMHAPDGRVYAEHYWNTSAQNFFGALAAVWNRWHGFYEDAMPVEIPDPWLLDAARAGITLCRCSYRGLEPTYQVGEGSYTKIPERSHALFPVAHYEFIWAQQLWGLTDASRPYIQHYLEHYVLPDGNFLYNTQDQVEAPLNVGIFLMNAARDYWYTGDADGLLRQQPILERMLGYVLARYEYGKQRFAKRDRRYGLIWGSPEADLGDPANDYPDSHPYYYQNAACISRGITEYAKALKAIGSAHNDHATGALSERYAAIATEMRQNIQTSIEATIAASTPEMRAAGITPFETNDILRKPTELSSYENHRFMMDWFLADWGVAALDLGHLKHRELAGQQICGLNTDGDAPRCSNFMSHGTLAVKIRQEDYRPFLLTLYALVCYAADSGNRYSPEDAYIPGSYPGDGAPWGWSAVVNSALQPALGLRWLLCYEENDRDICHLQKAAPKHWFSKGERIAVRRCPTRFGTIAWTTESTSDSSWHVVIEAAVAFRGEVHLHIHPPAGGPLRSASIGTVIGTVEGSTVVLPAATFASGGQVELEVRA